MLMKITVHIIIKNWKIIFINSDIQFVCKKKNKIVKIIYKNI